MTDTQRAEMTADGLWKVALESGEQRLYDALVVAKAAIDRVEQPGIDLIDADLVLNLDGGGTSTLVIDAGQGPQILNRPIHLGIPGNERPSASHLGVKALPLPAKPK